MNQRSQAKVRSKPPCGGFLACLAALCQAAAAHARSSNELLEGDLGTGLFELLLGGFGVSLREAFLDSLRGALDEVLRLLEAKARELTDGLDAGDLVRAGGLEDHVELGLLLSGGGTSGSARGSSLAL